MPTAPRQARGGAPQICRGEASLARPRASPSVPLLPGNRVGFQCLQMRTQQKQQRREREAQILCERLRTEIGGYPLAGFQDPHHRPEEQDG
jgi:hypothetical protein